MKVKKTITIKKPAAEVWNIIAHEFDQAYVWMGPIPHSYEIGERNSSVGAPMDGRICLLTEKPDGPRVRELITQYDEAGKSLTFSVESIDVPAFVPLKSNLVQMTVKPVDQNTSEVLWVAQPKIKPFAYLLYPLLMLGLPRAFGNLLAGLKKHAEAAPNKLASVA